MPTQMQLSLARRAYTLADARRGWQLIAEHRSFSNLGIRLPGDLVKLVGDPGNIDGVLSNKGIKSGNFIKLVSVHYTAIKQHADALDADITQANADLSPLEQMFHNILGDMARQIPPVYLRYLEDSALNNESSTLQYIRSLNGDFGLALEGIGFSETKAVRQKIQSFHKAGYGGSWLQIWCEIILEIVRELNGQLPPLIDNESWHGFGAGDTLETSPAIITVVPAGHDGVAVTVEAEPSDCQIDASEEREQQETQEESDVEMGTGDSTVQAARQTCEDGQVASLTSVEASPPTRNFDELKKEWQRIKKMACYQNIGRPSAGELYARIGEPGGDVGEVDISAILAKMGARRGVWHFANNIRGIIPDFRAYESDLEKLDNGAPNQAAPLSPFEETKPPTPPVSPPDHEPSIGITHEITLEPSADNHKPTNEGISAAIRKARLLGPIADLVDDFMSNSISTHILDAEEAIDSLVYTSLRKHIALTRKEKALLKVAQHIQAAYNLCFPKEKQKRDHN